MASRAKTYFDPKGIFLAPAGARGPQIENQPRDFVVHYWSRVLESHIAQTRTIANEMRWVLVKKYVTQSTQNRAIQLSNDSVVSILNKYKFLKCNHYYRKNVIFRYGEK